LLAQAWLLQAWLLQAWLVQAWLVQAWLVQAWLVQAWLVQAWPAWALRPEPSAQAWLVRAWPAWAWRPESSAQAWLVRAWPAWALRPESLAQAWRLQAWRLVAGPKSSTRRPDRQGLSKKRARRRYEDLCMSRQLLPKVGNTSWDSLVESKKNARRANSLLQPIPMDYVEGNATHTHVCLFAGD
jgi:hypothetical protein